MTIPEIAYANKTISDVQSYLSAAAVAIMYNDYFYHFFALLVNICISSLISYINGSLLEDLYDIFNSTQ